MIHHETDLLAQAKQRLPLPALMAQCGHGDRAKKSARCMFHEDSHNSFSTYQRDDGSWGWKCHAGCGGGPGGAGLPRAASPGLPAPGGAWGPGAADNVSGTVSVLESARAVMEQVRKGERPRRTIVFATWDAEEWGLIGGPSVPLFPFFYVSGRESRYFAVFYSVAEHT